MQFHTTILKDGNNTGIEVPDSVVEALGKGKRPPVKVTLNGYAYRSTVAVMGGKNLVGVSAAIRKETGIVGGESLDVEIELDEEPRVVELPIDFALALGRDAEAKAFFESLNYSNRRRLVMAIEAVKGADTRSRKVDTTVSRLHDGKA
jgi:hypothetical protein